MTNAMTVPVWLNIDEIVPPAERGEIAEAAARLVEVLPDVVAAIRAARPLWGRDWPSSPLGDDTFGAVMAGSGLLELGEIVGAIAFEANEFFQPVGSDPTRAADVLARYGIGEVTR